VISGSAETFTSTTVSLTFARADPVPEMTIPAAVRRVEEAAGRKDILLVGMEYSAEPPMSYKLMINSYLSRTKRDARGVQKPAGETARPALDSAPAASASEPPAADLHTEADRPSPSDGENPPDG
jgi:hypothetical protein